MNFGHADYGVLNEDLQIETGEFAEARQEKRERERRRELVGSASGSGETDNFNPLSQQPEPEEEAAGQEQSLWKRPRQTIAEVLGFETDAEGQAKISHAKPRPIHTQQSHAEQEQEIDPKKPPQWWRARDEVTQKEGADWLLKMQRENLKRPVGASIIENQDVKKTWEENKQSAAGSG